MALWRAHVFLCWWVRETMEAMALWRRATSSAGVARVTAYMVLHRQEEHPKLRPALERGVSVISGSDDTDLNALDDELARSRLVLERRPGDWTGQVSGWGGQRGDAPVEQR